MTSKLHTFFERSFSSLILILLLVGVIVWNSPLGYALFICIACNITSAEWFIMLRGRSERANRGLGLTAGLLYPWVCAATAFLANPGDGHKACYALSLGYLVIFILVAFFFELIQIDYKKRTGAQSLASMGVTILSFIYPVWFFAFALLTLSDANLIKILLWLICTTKMCDIWAYVSGVILGGRFFKRRFSPVVSPKKTWEGIIGSFLITSICSYGLYHLLMADVAFFSLLQPWLFFAVMMPVIFILSVVGDLAGSLIKRGLAIKDSGHLLPGIGGFFDLIDSPAFTVSAFVVILIGMSL